MRKSQSSVEYVDFSNKPEYLLKDTQTQLKGHLQEKGQNRQKFRKLKANMKQSKLHYIKSNLRENKREWLSLKQTTEAWNLQE